MTIELQPEFPHRTRKRAHPEPRLSGSEPQARKRAVPYVELHAHSSYSFLDGASLPEELAVQAAELGYPALALTDHDGLYGSLEFLHVCDRPGGRRSDLVNSDTGLGMLYTAGALRPPPPPPQACSFEEPQEPLSI